jgi:zinc transport system substrate-binding protein
MKMVFMLFRGRALGGLICSSLLILTTACGGQGAAGEVVDSSGGVQIVSGSYPFQFVAERVAGIHGTVSSLTKPGAEPHDVELTPQQVVDISTADLVVYERSFQPAVDETVAQSGNDQVLDTATVVPLQPLETAAEEHHEGDAAHQDGEAHQEGEAHHESETHAEGDAHEGGLDPHVWLDPTNVATIAGAVATRLAEIDPAHAADYSANAAALRKTLERLDEEFASGLASCRRTEFVTTHAAFGYLAKRYRLRQIAISGLSPDAEPSPARIAAVQDAAEEHQITTIFYETLVSPAVAQSIASDLGIRTDVLDPVEGITEQSRGEDYLSVMRANLTALKAANQCS